MTGYASVDWSSAQVETARLVLRPLRPQDADLLLGDREEPGSWCRDPAGDRGTGLRTAVTERATGRLIGAADLYAEPGPVPGTARIDLWIAAWARGRGHGTEVVTGLCAWAFRQGVVRVELLAGALDERAHRVALAAGFRREGLLRSALVGRDRVDAVLYGRLATDPPTPPRRGLPDVSELTDGVATIRPLRAGDEAALLDERLDPESQRWATSTRLWTAQDIRVFVAGTGPAWLAGTEARFAIVDAASNTCAGSLGLRMSVPAFRIAEIGYGLRASWRGFGLTTRAVRLVTDWAFFRAGIARLELGAAVENAASRRVAERAGFQPEGIARMRLPTSTGGRTDEARYGLLPPG
ncbi:MAG TPA: GNAT family N-acetyltransferase [Mycobacteriales bacterium]|nr:GNAT family N-acetyltransferase [Mycobacteriales bacterium]